MKNCGKESDYFFFYFLILMEGLSIVPRTLAFAIQLLFP